MLALGAALGGLVAGEWGIQPAFVIDSLTFLLSAYFILKVKYEPPTADDVPVRGGVALFSQITEGLRYLNQHRPVFLIGLQKAGMALGVSSMFQIIQVQLTSEVFVMGEGGSTSLGVMYAVVGVGTGFGPIVARWFTRDDEKLLRRAIASGYVIAAGGLLVVSTLSNFWIVLAGTFFRGLGVAVTWVFSTQLLLTLVPNKVRGRVFSTEFALLTLMNAIGAAFGGWLFDNTATTIPQMLWGMAVVTLLMGIVWVVGGGLRGERGEVDR
ncbi:MAG: MFS transporter [Chloroflexi bacterium]|nr:MFS transporter [Chloroflexota bacterium]